MVLFYILKIFTDLGPVSDLSVSSKVLQLTISWSPPSFAQAGLNILYEIGSNSTSGVFSYTNISATQHTLRDLPPNTVVVFSVRPYIENAKPGEIYTSQASTKSVRKRRHDSMNNYHHYLLTAHVTGVSAVALNSTAVRITWTPINLMAVNYMYTVHYITVCGIVNVSYPSSASSGVVSGLQEGHEYQFSVSAAFILDGVIYTGRE